ncbi:MAG: hypothetical protein IBX57_00040 [Gammaproteobacteria bacterium]|nr:hypothetical protein [Gammaproteobacteria bacterium]
MSAILFKDDWLKFPGAIVDYETKNESFKRMVSLYKHMGIENCLFPLALLQPELQGVDPFDPNLSDEMKTKIGMECTWNYWYFIREVARIPPVAGTNPIPYKANRGNLAVSWLFLNNIDSALIQPRQTGKSVSTDVIMDWVMYIAAVNTLVTLLTKDHDLRTKNVERLKKIRDLLPSYLFTLTSSDSDNQIGLTYRIKGNSYITGVAQNSESAANNLGRGLTSPIMHIDEGPFIKFIKVTLGAALASGTAAREEAEMEGKPYGNIFTTTAGKKDDRDGSYMYDFIHSGATWDEMFFDAKNKEDLIKLIDRNKSGKKILVNITMSHRQLGKTDKWLYDAMANANVSGEEADRDFFNRWTSGSQSSPLSTEVNKIIKDSETDPVYREISRDSYVVRWYVSEEELSSMMRTTSFIMGLDTSDAIGRDSLAIVIRDVKDLSVVGAATINETNLIRFSKFLADLLIKYPNITLIPEKKSSAQAIIDSLLIHLVNANIDPFRRIFSNVVNEYTEREREYHEIQTPMNRRSQGFYDRYKKIFGFNTSGSSRDLLFSTVLQTAAKESGHLVRDRTLTTEILGLVVKNGRIDHSNGNHDDMVFSWLLTQWMISHSKNLSFYGIDTSKVLSRVTGKAKQLSDFEMYEIEVQRDIKAQIEDIYEELTKVTDEFMIAQYERKLYSLNARLKDEDVLEGMTIDKLITDATETRAQNNRKRLMQQRARVGRENRFGNYYQ